MKKIILSLAVFSAGLIAYAQNTNTEGSSYSFTEVAHHDATPVLSQGYTGTCWSFSALSFFESEMIRKGVENPPILSQMYIARKAYEGKAENYIRMDGKSNFSQGGAFHDIPYVFERYGIVPIEAYEGLNYGTDKHNHKEVYSVLNGYMGGVLNYVDNKGDAALSKNWKAGLSGILDAYLGEDPTTFTYEGKEYTPKSFAESTKLNMDDYVSLTSFTHFPMHEEVQLLIPDNWSNGTSYNVSMDELLEATVSALENGYTVAWGADVSEKGFNFGKGLAIVPEDESTIKVRGRDNSNFSDAGASKESNAFLTPVKEITVTPEMRQEGYDNKTTTDDHGMHITGLYEEANGTRYFLVKNSWGTGNYPEGYLYVSENYFKLKTINVYLHKDGIPKGISKKIMK
ncbi:C1 family peptidase [Brumimicrobium aurantiacum]|uniref:Aminopeptidase n=1 Tax=Brumimicrobium aurantiacum TaxID=1737063 RepID=A0A3E1F1I2_9FLAO|nr:C1 family peptidase [Brumimicrobium aurantiacum]RFC55603.1 aminopeptidase [Brumimicrobium aurantiacum]